MMAEVFPALNLTIHDKVLMTTSYTGPGDGDDDEYPSESDNDDDYYFF